jgi:hypothetical protein
MSYYDQADDVVEAALEEDRRIAEERSALRRRLKIALWVLAGVSSKFWREFLPETLPEKNAEESTFEYQQRLRWIAKRRAGEYVALNVRLEVPVVVLTQWKSSWA